MKVPIIIVLVIFSVGCDSGAFPDQQFFYNSPEEQAKMIHTYTFSEQIDLMVLGMQQEPPQNNLVTEVAKNGEAIIPKLFEHLPKAKDHHELGVILFCLLEIDIRHHEWKADSQYLSLLKKELGKMSNKALQQEAKRMLLPSASLSSDF
ncbi:MAG: hypothetical protein KC643_25965 [Nitrospira sp.]|nr:hypothetical protein [Nitrospira sp.]